MSGLDLVPDKLVKIADIYKKNIPIFHVSKRFMFNMFAILYPYLLLNSLIDLTNAKYRGFITTASFLMSMFFLGVTFKISLLIIGLAIK